RAVAERLAGAGDVSVAGAGGLTGADTVVQVDGGVTQTRQLLAPGTGVRRFVYASSAMVYGAWPNNPVPLTEDAPVRPNPGFDYATAKAEGERLAVEWRDGNAGARLAVLRPATVLGEQDRLTRLLRDVLPAGVADPMPP